MQHREPGGWLSLAAEAYARHGQASEGRDGKQAAGRFHDQNRFHDALLFDHARDVTTVGAGMPAFFRLMCAGARTGLDGCGRIQAGLDITRQMSGFGNPDIKGGRSNV